MGYLKLVPEKSNTTEAHMDVTPGPCVQVEGLTWLRTY